MNDYDPKTYWEERGKDYSVSVDTSDELRNLAKLRLLHGRYMDSVLEMGSGYGRIYSYLNAQGLLEDSDYSMCDISESMIKECYKRTGIHPLLWDGKTLPYENNKFDWLISFSVLLHVPPSDLKDHFAECLRVCKKYLYIATYNGPAKRLAKHNFAHDYQELFSALDVKILNEKTFRNGLRVNWLLKKNI